LNIETLFNSADLKRFHFPGTVVWGAGCRDRIADLAADSASVWLFVDAYFAEDPFTRGLREALGARLTRTEICATTPRTESLRAMAESGQPPEAVIAIGGGSTMDAAKAVIAHWLYGTFDGVGMGEKRGLPPLQDGVRPLLITAPTTAGTGADASRYYVTYGETDHAKVHGKSWRLVADWLVLDPAFMRGSPGPLLVSSAFDAFIHCFESYLCRYERSWFGDMLSLDAMPRIVRALDRALNGAPDDETLLELLYAATIGGMAISNIRTGNIHEAAGALLEATGLTHPETLMVFLKPAYRQYREAIADREALLMRRFASDAPELGFETFEDVIAWWERAFDGAGLMRRIREGVAGVTLPESELKARIFERVATDRVWCGKESPAPLDDDAVRGFIDDALSAYERAR